MDSDSLAEGARTNVSGFWIDPVTQIVGGFKKSVPKSFKTAVGGLTGLVLEKVNKEYSLKPPLKRADMIVKPLIRNSSPTLLSFLLNVFITGPKDGDDDLHGIDGIDDEPEGLVVLVTPNKKAASRIKSRFLTLQETESKASDLVRHICREELDDRYSGEGMITTRLHLSC
jgi:hypothetical protein